MDQLGGDDVPGVLGDDVGCEEVEGSGGVGLVAAAHGADISGLLTAEGGLYLHADEASGLADHEVVAGEFSPGLAHRQTMLVGAGHENRILPIRPAVSCLQSLSASCLRKLSA